MRHINASEVTLSMDVAWGGAAGFLLEDFLTLVFT